MSTDIPERQTVLLTINDFDIINSFPEESRHLVRNITEEQFNDIAALAWDKMTDELGDHFWEIFSDSIQEATMEVLDLDFNDDYEIEQ